MSNKAIDRSEYTVMKIGATILVVIGHITKFYIPEGGVVSVSPNMALGLIAKWIYLFHMPLFVFISGAIYSFNLNQQRKYRDFSCFFKKKFKRLIIPYLFWGIFFVTPVMVGFKFTNLSIAQYVFGCILMGGDSRHLWYLWTLFLLFCIFGVFQKYKKIVRSVCIILVFLLSCALYYITGLGPFWNVFYYGIFFSFGYLFDLYKNVIDNYSAGRVAPIILTFVLLSTGLFGRNNVAWNIVYALSGIVFSYLFVKKAKTLFNCMNKWTILKKDSFGIYLIHPMLIYVIFYFCNNNIINPYFFSFITFGVVMFVSIILTEIIRRIHFQVVLGE